MFKCVCVFLGFLLMNSFVIPIVLDLNICFSALVLCEVWENLLDWRKEISFVSILVLYVSYAVELCVFVMGFRCERG